MLSPLADVFNAEAHPELLVGMGPADDASVIRINRKTAVIATVDFFAPLVDDPTEFGAIAAANAMSDVYAMGGEVVLALNIAAFPEDMPPEAVTAIFRGGALKVAEGGGIVAGGHSIWDPEPKYGLSVLGLAHPSRLFLKSALRPGDVLYLTKPLGAGSLLSAAKAGAAEPGDLQAAVASMTALNRHPSHLCHEARARAATDVTGFGLLGHLWEMASTSGVACEVSAAALPLLPGAARSLAAGFHTGGENRNRSWLSGHVTIADGVPPEIEAAAFDPQTSGGLLVGLNRRAAGVFEAAAARDGVPVWSIGRVRRGTPHITIA